MIISNNNNNINDSIRWQPQSKLITERLKTKSVKGVVIGVVCYFRVSTRETGREGRRDGGWEDRRDGGRKEGMEGTTAGAMW